MNEPDFYLASTETYGLEEPRRCWRIKRVIAGRRDDFLLVRIDPPIPGREYSGVGDFDINLVLLATRHVGASLFPINEWPIYVHVACPLVPNPESRDTFLDGGFTSLAWAELYRTELDARIKAM